MLANLRKLISRSAPSAADIERELSKLDAKIVEAREQLAAADAGRGEALLRGDDAARTNREFIARTTEDLRDLEAARPLLAKRLDERRSAEADAAREARYRAAETAAARAKDAILDRLPKHISEHLALIRLFEEARQEIEVANSDLPPGASHIPDPEAVIRDLAALDREVLDETRTVVWIRTDCYPGKRIDPGSISTFEDLGGGRGQFREKSHGVDVIIPCVGRVEITQSVALFEHGERATRLRDVAMPGFRYFNPGYVPRPWANPTPGDVLRAVAEAEQDRIVPISERYIRTEVTSEPLPGPARPGTDGLSLSQAGPDLAAARPRGRAGLVSSYVNANQQRIGGVVV